MQFKVLFLASKTITQTAPIHLFSVIQSDIPYKTVSASERCLFIPPQHSGKSVARLISCVVTEEVAYQTLSILGHTHVILDSQQPD